MKRTMKTSPASAVPKVAGNIVSMLVTMEGVGSGVGAGGGSGVVAGGSVETAVTEMGELF
jgi:hypothetical protein